MAVSPGFGAGLSGPGAKPFLYRNGLVKSQRPGPGNDDEQQTRASHNANERPTHREIA
jgi:hypothetical protein